MSPPHPARRLSSARPLCGVAYALLIGLLVSCSHDDTIKLAAPFNDRTVVGDVSAVWSNTGEERGFAAGDRLAEPDVRFSYRVDVHNRLGDKLFVRLGEFQLVGENGLPLATDPVRVECALADGATRGVLAGDIWVAKHATGMVKAFRVSHFAVPLSDRGRALYREWQLQGRPGAAAEIDAEIARYAAMPPCLSH